MLSAVKKTDLTETVASQETVMQSQLTSATPSTTSVSASQTTVTQAVSENSQLSSARMFHLSSSVVEIPQQKQRLEAWLSLGSYEDVLNSDFHYWEVKKQLKDNGMEMTRILRLHTPELRLRFDSEVETVKKSRPQGFNVNVKDLYHGTTAPLDQICAEGLDPRISVHGHFGRGMYFSDNPEMCRAFCERTVSPTSTSLSDEHFVMRCQVILGDVKQYRDGESAPELTREPEKEHIGGKKTYYDSVQGKVGPYKQYVVYEKRRVYVQYVVFYKSDRPVPQLPEVVSVSRSRRHSGSRRPASDDERNTDTDNSDDDDSRVQLQQRSAASVDWSSSSENVCSDLTTASDDSSVKKVSVTRERTRALLQARDCSVAEVTSSNSEASLPATSSLEPATATATAAAAAAAVSCDSGSPQLDTSAATLSYRQEFEINAIQKMLELKGRISDKQMDDLITSYTAMYGPPQLSSAQFVAAAAAQSPAAVVDDDDDDGAEHQVLEHLVDEFLQLVVSVDRRSAQQYIISNQMNLEDAVGAYFDDHA